MKRRYLKPQQTNHNVEIQTFMNDTSNVPIDSDPGSEIEETKDRGWSGDFCD